ncbi:mitoguardin isoform X3 [Amblyomma americanum]
MEGTCTGVSPPTTSATCRPSPHFLVGRRQLPWLEVRKGGRKKTPKTISIPRGDPCGVVQPMWRRPRAAAGPPIGLCHGSSVSDTAGAPATVHHGCVWFTFFSCLFWLATSVAPELQSGFQSSDESTVTLRLGFEHRLPFEVERSQRMKQHLAITRLDSLDQALHCWEQALQQLRPEDPAAGALAASLQSLLADGRWLRSQGRLLAEGTIDAVLLPQLSADVPPRPASTADTESFVSAEGTSDVAVLSELSTVPPADQCALYREALELLDREGIPCRSDRAEVVRCSSKQDYLAKIHCIRLAFKRLTGQPDVLEWLIDAANHVLGGFMLCAGKDPKDALHAYRELVAYLLDSSHHDQVVLELRNKGVVCATVYDVVIDYVLLDAFEDLSSPPQPVVAVIQNRWLTAGFKETALSAAIWSLFKAKKRLLPFSGGFFAHYYALMEQVVPVLAWGFLGSDVDLKEMCSFFKDEVEALVCDMFDPSRSRYTSVDDLALDILRNSQLHYNRVCQALAGALLPEPAPP